MVNLLNGPCELCGAARHERCAEDCPGEARARLGPADLIAQDLRDYPRPVRPYSHAIGLLRTAGPMRRPKAAP